MATASDTHVLRIDSLLRQATSLLWKSLPPDRRNAEDLQSEALRLQMRMLQNFTDDLTAFSHGEAAATGTPREAASAAIRERYPMTGKPWSAEAEAELRALFESGNAIDDLSLYFQRTPNGVRARLVKLGLLAETEFRPRFAA